MELILNPNKPQKISYAEVQNFEISSNNLVNYTFNTPIVAPSKG